MYLSVANTPPTAKKNALFRNTQTVKDKNSSEVMTLKGRKERKNEFRKPSNKKIHLYTGKNGKRWDRNVSGSKSQIPVNKIAVTLHLVACPRCLSLQIATQSAVAAVAAAWQITKSILVPQNVRVLFMTGCREHELQIRFFFLIF